MNNNIDLYLQELETAKVDIKGAIIAKGVTPDGGLSSYGEAINNIEQGVSGDELQEMIQNAMDEGYQDGYAEGVDDGILEQKSLLESITITENGTYTKEDGYNEVIVEVAGSGGGASGLDFESIGWSPTYSKEVNDVFNERLAYSKSVYDRFNALSTEGKRSFNIKNDTEIIYGPTFDYNGYAAALYLTGFCNGCKNLQYAPVIINYSNLLNTTQMFNGCTSLISVPLFDTSKVTTMISMFNGCTSLTSVPLFDTSSVTDSNGMLRGCTSLTSVPLFDTSSVTDISNMFYGCTSLTSIPLLDTSSVTNINGMLRGCTSLTSVPLFDTSSVTDMQAMFYGCTSLTSVPQFNTSKVKTWGNIFNSCTSLTSVPLLDMGSTTDVGYFFGFSTNMSNIKSLGGFKDLGKQPSVGSISSNYFINSCTSITRESLLNVFNNLYDRAAAGMSVLTLKINTKHHALLSADDIAIATNKGWTIS